MVNFYSERFQLNKLHRKIRFQFDCKHFFKCVLVVFSITLLGEIFKMLLTLASDWLRKWHEFPGPITGPCKAKPLQSQITFNSQLKSTLTKWMCSVIIQGMSIYLFYGIRHSVEGETRRDGKTDVVAWPTNHIKCTDVHLKTACFDDRWWRRKF